MLKRRASRPIQVGSVTVGGAGNVIVQSMTKTNTRNAKATLDQITQLADAGCEIIRIAVPDAEAAGALAEIKRNAPIPIIADIHFDHRLAISSMENGVDQVRFNPGNIQNADHVASIVRTAKERSIPLRIGVNAGSLAHERDEGDLASKMSEAALKQIQLLESMDFDLIEVSLKASDVIITIEANKAIAEKMPYPLHIGVTEAGLPKAGSIRSAVGLGTLLYLGIGDTIRVSLTTPDPREEVLAGYEILKSLELRERGPRLVSCPTCGRCEARGFYEIANTVEEQLSKMETPITVAVMGCVVNGPGEAKDADVGLACGKGKGVIFKKGEKVRTVEEPDFLAALMKEVNTL
ncbi:MAG: flavodoxin-dependent (E)-4-hydroxy-3-methylbut-2-enyl-diphosphate synthase [Chloroflexi bacterium]|jgi:(E)-4-hydroxy-3-methylbut-2-enyl-diphosphate synthase|nr:flavodoxin-dependent (E)-4-hydroxy-3-methylbut-2-enyl-diphosphate synthase [Chloroflexota bacterium]